MNKRKLKLLCIDFLIIVVILSSVAYAFPYIGSFIIINNNMWLKILVYTVILSVFRYIFCIYSSVWRYADVGSYARLIIADYCSLVIYTVISRFILALNTGFSFIAVATMLIMLVTLISRFIYQLLYSYYQISSEKGNGKNNKINIAIVGAGNVGALLADELMRNPKAHYNPYCFIDNNPAKIGSSVRGIKIYAENEKTIELLKLMPVQEIVIAIPDAEKETKTQLYQKYIKTGCKVKVYDYLSEQSAENGDKRTLREFKIEELLFRDSVSLNKSVEMEYYCGKTILVTGGGGSIGSELCRQIAKCKPKALIIVDIYENNAYEIQQELVRKYKDKLNLFVEIASVRDENRMENIFSSFRPEIVFHAAAHKHVPLMEESPQEAIKNNVFGTYNVANMAEKYETAKFILISTDKAVNPTNVMGASKRLCEMLIQCRRDSKTEFAAVRFGNVLGSNGSVIPLFKKQIENGGPITLTDKRIIRYFMTIPEAVSLVMETGVMAKKGELFVLDMGNPVKIIDLAEKMVELSGLTPYKDIDIIEIGLRPGEKLYEELLIKTEELDRTENNLIFIERDQALTRQQVDEKLALLSKALTSDEKLIIIDSIKKTVPTYCHPNDLNERAKDSEEMQKVRENALI